LQKSQRNRVNRRSIETVTNGIPESIERQKLVAVVLRWKTGNEYCPQREKRETRNVANRRSIERQKLVAVVL
jgi:hypothetical protein